MAHYRKINKITRDTHPEIFEYFDNDDWDWDEQLDEVHVKHDITSYQIRMVIDENVTKDESLWGSWVGWYDNSYAYGSEPEDYPQELWRVEQKEVTKIEWVVVE
jgi:hypothetical protein